MKVRFAEDVLNDKMSWDYLDWILFHFIDRRHFWDIENPTIIEQSPWIQQDLNGRSGRRVLEVLSKCYTDSAYPRGNHMHSISLVVTLQDKSDLELRPDKAKKCLDSPVFVFVENAESDGAFINAMVNAHNRIELLESKEKGWWRVEHLGGFGEVEKRVNQFRKGAVGFIRLFVIADSDRLYPGHVSGTIIKIEGFCKSKHVPYKILNKRKIENYLPISVLQKFAGLTMIFRAFLHLNQTQRDYFDMKGGFKKESNNRAIIPIKQEQMFEFVPQYIKNRLCGGFGPELWKCFTKYQNDITEEEIRLICPDEANEINNFLDHIESLI